MDTKNYIDELFAAYEETRALADFKEELQSNLNERINSLERKGLDKQAAFAAATLELGDVSALADEISLRKKQEVLEEMYLGNKKHLTPLRTLLYICSGAAICLGPIFAAITWFATGQQVAALGSTVFFCAGGLAALTILWLTQETNSKYAMKWQRALLYGLAVGFFIFGLFTVPLTYFSMGGELSARELAIEGLDISGQNIPLMAAISSMLPFIMPSLALGAFLLLTEKDRRKAWVLELRKKAIQQELSILSDPARSRRLGLISGALWLAALTCFILLTLTIGWRFSWLALMLALILQMLILASFAKEKAAH